MAQAEARFVNIKGVQSLVSEGRPMQSGPAPRDYLGPGATRPPLKTEYSPAAAVNYA